MLSDELGQLLRDFAKQTEATHAWVAHPKDEDSAPQGENLADVTLGGGAVLYATFAGSEPTGSGGQREVALERLSRALRACARRWDVEVVPEVSLPPKVPRTPRVLIRMQTYLDAFTSTMGMVNAVVTHHGDLVTSANSLSELQWERIPFILKQVDAEAARHSETSHAEMVGDDFYAVSFWFDACLVAFFEGPYPLDFVRHRARLVTREIAQLMPLIDDPDHDPAQEAPVD